MTGQLSSCTGIRDPTVLCRPTGSGKTYTLETLLPLVSQLLFCAIRDQRDREITVRVSALEVYNERIRDLLQDDSESQDLDVVDQTKRATLVRGLTDTQIHSADELNRIAARVADRRTVRAALSLQQLQVEKEPDGRPKPSTCASPAHPRSWMMARLLGLHWPWLDASSRAGGHIRSAARHQLCALAGAGHQEQCCKLPESPGAAHPHRQPPSRCCLSLSHMRFSPCQAAGKAGLSP